MEKEPLNLVIITGASRGIGYQIAQLFQENNWQVINISRQACTLPAVKNFSIDFSQKDWAEHYGTLLKETISAYAATRICLVHNAALYENDRCDDLNADHLRRVFEVNLIAPCLLNKIFIPLLPPSSSILYIGSTLSEKAVAGCASYVMSKHALAGLMKSTTQDLAGRAIHSACICPGFTDTEMLRDHLQHDLNLLETLAQKNAAGRMITPAEIAQLTLFCAENPVINGSVLHAHLGQLET